MDEVFPRVSEHECQECGVNMWEKRGGEVRCPYCESHEFRDDVSDGEIYAAVSGRRPVRRW